MNVFLKKYFNVRVLLGFLHSMMSIFIKLLIATIMFLFLIRIFTTNESLKNKKTIYPYNNWER